MTGARKGPAMTAQGEAGRLARLAREADALRANLRRRKEQSRGRSTEPQTVHDRLNDEPPTASDGVENAR